MHRHNFYVINFIYNILGIDVPSKTDTSFDALCHLLGELGFEISQKRLEAPTTRLNYLVIIVDTINFIVFISPDNLKEITTTCLQWRHIVQNISSNHCWKACYMSINVFKPPGHFSMFLDVLRSTGDRQYIALTVEAKRDINWFIKFLLQFNGVTFFDQRPTNISIELDGSLQGLVARWGTKCMILPYLWVTLIYI